MEKVPLTVGESGYISDLLLKARRRMDITDAPRHAFQTVSRMTFPWFKGTSEAIGAARRLRLAEALGFSPPVAGSAPRVSKKQRRDDAAV